MNWLARSFSSFFSCSRYDKMSDFKSRNKETLLENSEGVTESSVYCSAIVSKKVLHTLLPWHWSSHNIISQEIHTNCLGTSKCSFWSWRRDNKAKNGPPSSGFPVVFVELFPVESETNWLMKHLTSTSSWWCHEWDWITDKVFGQQVINNMLQFPVSQDRDEEITLTHRTGHPSLFEFEKSLTTPFFARNRTPFLQIIN